MSLLKIFKKFLYIRKKFLRNERAFEFSPWVVITTKDPDSAPCGYEGQFTTPKLYEDFGCYNMIIDCSKNHSLKIIAMDCQTRTILESNS